MQNIFNFLSAALTNDAVKQGVLYLVGLLLAAVLRLKAVKKYRLEKIAESAQVAVQETYSAYVRAAKKGTANGKLSDTGRAYAQEEALKRLKEILADEGISLAKYYGPRAAEWLIEKAVARNKIAGRVARAALSPLPEPELHSASGS